MTVKGGAHVSIDGVTYQLAEDEPNHYVHRIPTLDDSSNQIQGALDKLKADPERLTWAITDWSGGEGNSVFYDQEPNVYDYAVGMNTRMPGQLTARPKRTRATVAITSTTTTTQDHWAKFFEGFGRLYIYCSTKVSYGEGDASWTAVNPTLPASHAITAMTGDSDFIYGSSWKDGGATRNDRLMFYSVDGGTNWRNLLVNQVLNASSTVESSKNGYFSLVMHNGKLFAWTGRQLWTYDVGTIDSDGTPGSLASDQYRKVYDTGTDARRPFSNQYWAGMVDCGTSVAFFSANRGDSTLYLWKNGVARPIWRKRGFTIRGIAHNGGMLYVSGNFMTSDNEGGQAGNGALYMLPLGNLSEVFLKWVRFTIDGQHQMQIASPGFGNTFLTAASRTGRLFEYDLDTNSLSLIDDLAGNNGTTQETGNESGGALAWTSSDHRIGDIVAYGRHRVISIYRPGATGETTIQTLHYRNDHPDNRMTTATNMNWYAISPQHDFGYPEELKALLGFFVSFRVEDTATTSGLLANQRIRVQYAKDDGTSPSWTTADTITSSSTPSNSTRGRYFVDLTSSTVKFTRLRVRVIVDNNNTAGVQPPIVHSVTAAAELLSYNETWDLLLRIKDDQSKTRSTAKAPKSNVRRDQLITARRNRNVVDFVDGYIYRESGRVPPTVRVLIKHVEDEIDRNAEGVMRVVLKRVPL